MFLKIPIKKSSYLYLTWVFTIEIDLYGSKLLILNFFQWNYETVTKKVGLLSPKPFIFGFLNNFNFFFYWFLAFLRWFSTFYILSMIFSSSVILLITHNFKNMLFSGTSISSIILSKLLKMHDSVIGIISTLWDGGVALSYVYASENWQLYLGMTME